MAIENKKVLAASEALSIRVDADYVNLIQEAAHSENDHYINIPRLAFAPVLNEIFKHLGKEELEEIRLCAEVRISYIDEPEISHE